MEIDMLLSAILQNGFPAVVAIYLLVRFEAKLDSLTAVIQELKCTIEK